MSDHYCNPPTQDRAFSAYGEAVEDCHEDERGFFWVGNGEYGTPVEFCPFCGAKAPRDPRETMEFVESPGGQTMDRRRYRGVGQ